MNKLEVRRKWIEALRSGDYKQGKQYLRKRDEYCCLGVLCEILNIPHKIEGDGTYRYAGERCFLPTIARRAVGLMTTGGCIRGMIGSAVSGETVCDYITSSRSLSKLNDSGESFDTIADVIEAAPEGLFED